MTWWSAYGREKAGNVQLDEDDDSFVFTSHFEPGERPVAVVLLPALFLGNWMWDKVHEKLRADGYPVITFEESISVVDQKTARSINRIAARLREECRKHTDLPLVVAGDSLGGLIAFEFARSFPEETAGLIVSGAPGLNLKMSRFVRELAEESRSMQEYADAFMQRLLYDPSRHHIDQERYEAVVRELGEVRHLISMGSAIRAINRYNSRKVVMEIETPKLFLWGRQDEITPPEDWEKAVPKMTNARIVVFDECGHGPMFEKPDEFYAECATFLEGLSKPQAPRLASGQS